MCRSLVPWKRRLLMVLGDRSMQTRAPGYPQAEEIQFEAVRKENINHRWGDVPQRFVLG